MKAQAQGMDPCLELIREHTVDASLSLDPRHPLKYRRHDSHTKVGFAFGPRARMPRMPMGLVLYQQLKRRKRRLQLCPYGFRNTHLTKDLSNNFRDVKQEVFLSSLPSSPILKLQWQIRQKTLRNGPTTCA